MKLESVLFEYLDHWSHRCMLVVRGKQKCVSVYHLWPDYMRRMLIPGVNKAKVTHT